MTDFLLVRHAAHDWLGRGIPGRLPGVALNAQGRVQAEALAERLLAADIGAIYSSPQLRARETAAPLAARLRLQVGLAGEFDEVDFGDWTGPEFDTLYATCGDKVYRRKLKVRGANAWDAPHRPVPPGL